jgi:guanylate kinase
VAQLVVKTKVEVERMREQVRMSNDGPLLVIVSSPSGAGKTTLANRLLATVPRLVFSVSHTTRKPRRPS